MSMQTREVTSPIGKRLVNYLAYTKEHGLTSAAKFAWWKLRATLAHHDSSWNIFFRNNPFVATGELSDYQNCAESVWEQLRLLPNLETNEWQIDPLKYRDYVNAAHCAELDHYYRGGASGNSLHRAEKLLQHYISMGLLCIDKRDVFIDVASNTSPIRHIVKRLYGASCYSLDLSYPPGVHGELIGADAGAMPLESGSVSKMSLHCSFEHFACGADTRFVRECARVLRPGGRVCIVPLYVLPNYCILVDPTLEMDISIRDTEGAKVVYVRGYHVDYGRFYNPEAFKQRILSAAEGLRTTVYRVRGLEKLQGENVYSHFALVLEKL